MRRETLPMLLLLTACTKRPPPEPVDDATAICLSPATGDGAIDKQLRTHRQMAEKLPLKLESWIGLGHLWLKKARETSDPTYYLQVGKCADAALKVAPGDAGALALRATVQMSDHRFREARATTEAIVKANPGNVLALGILSDALLELGEVEAAAAAAQQMMDQKPGPPALLRGAYLRWLHGDVKGAKELNQEAITTGRDTRDPGATAWAFTQAAMVFWHEADYAGADLVFAETDKWVPGYPAGLVGRARCALARGQAAAAVGFLERAQKQDPLVETAWLLGDAKVALGDDKGAAAAYGLVLKQGQRTDRLTLAQFLSTKNREPSRALELIEAERKDRGGIYVDDTHAWALFRAGKLAEARQAIDRAIRLGTRDAKLLYHAGAIRLAAGDESGRKLVEQALGLNPGFDQTGAAEARKLLGAKP